MDEWDCGFCHFPYAQAMNLAELFADEELRRREFPVVRERVFLAHAGDCPLPFRVAQAVAGYAHLATTHDQERVIYPMILERGRAVVAQL